MMTYCMIRTPQVSRSLPVTIPMFAGSSRVRRAWPAAASDRQLPLRAGVEFPSKSWSRGHPARACAGSNERPWIEPGDASIPRLTSVRHGRIVLPPASLGLCAVRHPDHRPGPEAGRETAASTRLTVHHPTRVAEQSFICGPVDGLISFLLVREFVRLVNSLLNAEQFSAEFFGQNGIHLHFRRQIDALVKVCQPCRFCVDWPTNVRSPDERIYAFH